MSAAKCLLSLMVVLMAAMCAVQAQERIKMCGRELIRLAVSSCGNSRLRRSIQDIELGQHKFTFHWDQNASTEETQASETPSDGEKDVFFLAPHWYPLSNRIRRAAGKISDICCEKGCSLKELIQFC
ncbi:insulin-like 3 (Leydig cell) [Scomber japonicus]|uniref:insulin-like 3 (Leydig cell) n=1 Tax=Scomber japonicus TaxID=13676 RepID=UPI0023056898|nr:insulin-like 3 (Leydig cell) [Scomber japonicus]